MLFNLSHPGGSDDANPCHSRERGLAGAVGRGVRSAEASVARLVSRPRRLRSVAAAAAGCLLQPDERLLAYPRPPLCRRIDRRGARLARAARAARQYAALETAGIRTPDTVLVAGKELLVAAARQRFAEGPFILKPNRGGKGLGVRLFHTADALADYLDGPDYEPPVDGLHLLQQYIRAPVPLITRAEFVGGRFMYAVEVDTSDGFELCPADVCV